MFNEINCPFGGLQKTDRLTEPCGTFDGPMHPIFVCPHCKKDCYISPTDGLWIYCNYVAFWDSCCEKLHPLKRV